jgi:hypothetical protein
MCTARTPEIGNFKVYALPFFISSVVSMLLFDPREKGGIGDEPRTQRLLKEGTVLKAFKLITHLKNVVDGMAAWTTEATVSIHNGILRHRHVTQCAETFS